MIRSLAVLTVLAVLAGQCAAADLLEESARWAPIADHGAPGIECADGYRYEGLSSQWWAQALAAAQPRLRLDGLRIVEREQPGAPDAQLAAGYHYDHIAGDIFTGGPWCRGYARAGTDPLAAEPGRALAAVGFAIANTPLVGIDAEIGDSSERHLIATGDLHLPFLHVALAHDDRVDTSRVGFEVRFPGSVNELAWDLALDGATTRWNDLPSGVTRRAAGFLGELTVVWSPWNHWLIAGQAAVATNAMRDDGWQGTIATASLALGLGW